MNASRRRFLTAALVPVAMILAACGNNGTTNEGPSQTPPNTATAAGSSSTTSDGISTAKASGVGNVLVNAEGFTLYYLETDAQSQVTCTGGCAETWPPDLVTTVPDAAGLSAQLGTIANPSGGTQLTYDGWPLYTYAGDSAPGQANGQGSGGVWYAMTPTGATEGAAATGGGKY
jgi:predicted lipoprotein with Yx(FWY)xxD motif